jgi:uncharacterized protein (TIGR04551 family)
MQPMNRSWSWPALALVTMVPLAAQAQAGLPGPAPNLGEEEQKKEGVAEKAPKEATQLPTLPPLPAYPGQEKKKFELLTLDGYMRVRANWLDNYNLGFHDNGLGVPFREPLTCRNRPDLTAMGQTGATVNTVMGSCGGSIGTSNMRVRIEPTFHLSESVAFHMQVDALDNVVLGSTPDGVVLNGSGMNAPWIPASITSSNQVPPSQGNNAPWDSIRVKQAWGEVKTPLGTLEFGRMPNQWGLGILFNAGGYDWIHGTTCLDCDYGDTIDRFMFGTTIPGTNVRAAVAFDWAASGPSAGQLDAWKIRQDGQPYDLEDTDDVTEYAAMVTRIDDPEDWNAAVRQGQTRFNWGVHFVYRSQDYEDVGFTFGTTTPERNYLPRHATMYIPDGWARFSFQHFVFEGEFAAQLGNIDNLAANFVDSKGVVHLDPTKPKQSFQELGGVLRADYYAVNDDLDFGLEVGFASGDQWENTAAPGVINVHETSYYPTSSAAVNDTSISNFRFAFDYRPDLIFFRDILGAVTNATYVKPSIRYNVTDRFWFKASGIGSFANVPVATPGNGTAYGLELDADVGYQNVREGFFAGISYGVFFPFSALDHPNTLPVWANETNTGAGTAQTVQSKFILKF